jgi:undecaprenyl-diphosphatase
VHPDSEAEMIEILKSIILGIIEGITEWLPVSSTGHMILVDEFLKLNASEGFKELFFVVIQLGAILSVPVLFFDKLNPFGKNKNNEEKNKILSLWGKVIVGIAPAGVIGVLFDDWFDGHFYNYIVVSLALIVYGVVFIVIEKQRSKRGESTFRVNDVYEITYKDAIKIGLFQVLSLIPGTSRSGSTIIGGMLSGVSRSASAEFSFFMAIPIMLGASLLKILKFILAELSMTSLEAGILVTGILVSFVVSLASIKFLMEFVRRHDFSVFGIYRIVLGAIVLMYFIFN